MENRQTPAAADPRDLSALNPNEQNPEQNQPGRHPEEQEREVPTAIPETDNGDSTNPMQHPDTETSGYKKEQLIPVKNTDEEEEDEEQEEDQEEEEDEEDDDDQEEGDEEEEMDDEENSESGRNTTMQAPGDDFSSPAKPNDTNFEDPAQNRKTDPMTDHEPRAAGI